MRTGLQVVRVVSYIVPATAFLTLVYSFFRMGQALGGRYINAYVDASSTFFAMGMLAEVISADGLIVRSDTGSHGAYGMYLAFVLVFSLCLALFRGWDGIVNRSYAALQAVVVCPLCLIGIFFTGSRSSLVLIVGALLLLVVLLVLNPGRVITGSRRLMAAALIVVVPFGLLGLVRTIGPSIPTLERMQETLTHPLEIGRTARGDLSPMKEGDDGTERSVKNVQMRVWLWGQAIRYLVAHPMTMVTGIGYDRRRFVEDVVGVPYEGYNFNYQTAHNLFLDILIKGGVGPLLPLLAACLWLFWVGVKSVTIPIRDEGAIARIGTGWALLAFWPALILVSFTCEELLTDNLMLHWTALFGLLLGLCGTALATWLPNRMVHMTATAGIGGGPAYITALCRHHLAKGMEVRIFCSDEKPYVDIWRRMGIDLSVLPMRRPNALSVWQLLKELLRAPAPIHAHGRGAAFFAIGVKILVRVPVIYTPHGPHYAYNRGRRYVSGWLFEALCRVLLDAIIYVSAGEREVARQRRLPIGNSCIVVSGLVCRRDGTSFETAARDLLRAELNIPPGRFVIGWIGRFHEQKGLDILLESIPSVCAKIPAPIWVVVGDGTAQDTGACRAKLGETGLAAHVLFLGGRADAFALIRAFDLYISTSRWEGLPLVLLEVMEQGVPIVASDVVGNRDVLEGWGVLYAPNDSCAAADAQVRLATDESLRQRLVAAGREVRLTRFSLSRMLADMDRAYVEILGDEIAGEVMR
ncbi:MAG: glycosyltransferase family 4 protein [Nitrospira defluvii]|nr:glycosyltransferase family 4 protein [Nitrospira defluvii]